MPYKDPEAKRANSRAYYRKNRAAKLAYQAAYAQEHQAEAAIYQAAYRAVHRKEKLRWQQAYNSLHKSERTAYDAAYYQTHKDIKLEQVQRWAQNNPERARHNNRGRVARHRARKLSAPINDFTAAQWEEIKSIYKHCCAYCGRKMKRLEQDHITPLSKGGSHTASNIVPACRSCNASKHAGPPLKPVQPLLLTVA